MDAGLLFALALALAYAGMAGLCLAMDRHHRQVWRRDAAPALARRLRGAGALLLALALRPCLAGWGASVGALLWLGALSAGALALALLLAYAPRLVPRSAAMALAVALLQACVVGLRPLG